MNNFNKYLITYENLPDCWRKSWKNTQIKYDLSVYRSHVAACLLLGNTDVEQSEELPKGFFEFLRDRSLELVDWFFSQGYRLPLVVIVQNEKHYPELKALAGDQEFLRSQFSIQPVKSASGAEKVLRASLVPEFDEIEEVFPKTDEQLSKELATKLSDPSIRLADMQRELLEQVRSALRTSSAEHHLNDWEKGLEKDYQSMLEGKSEPH